MHRIASFHLVRERPGRAPLVAARLAADRPRLRRVAGLRFWRLLGTGRGGDTSPSVDPRRSAVFAVWDDEAALDRFVAGHPVVRRWERAEEAWHVRLRSLGGHGSWRGVDVLDGLDPGSGDGPVAVLTRADVGLRSWRRFAAASRLVADELSRAEGLIAVVGVGEAPVARLGTFGLWSSLDDVRRFATSMPIHREVVLRTRRERWYGEELFARFEPYGSSGSWDGRDPLAAPAGHDR